MIWFPFPCGKMDVATCFETIFPSKTPWKLNKIDRAGFIVLCSFVLGGCCLCLCHGNCELIYLYGPFTITSLSWANNRGNIRSSLFPFLMISSIQPQDFRQRTHTHTHTCAHTQPRYWWKTYGWWIRFPSQRAFDFFRLIFLRVKEKGGCSFLVSCQDARDLENTRWRQKKVTEAFTHQASRVWFGLEE